MYSVVLGYRINLIYCAICVAIWDIIHILFEYHERYERLQLYESFEEIGCLNDFGKPHCVAILTELCIYSLDLVFCVFLIFGASAMKRVWVLAWILLSVYHLVDFLLFFTPIYGEPLSLNVVPLYMWADIGKPPTLFSGRFLQISSFAGISVLGLSFVIYFFKKLNDRHIQGVTRERLTNVEEFTGVDFGAY
ncbi:unnamed protein product [Chironomus riparius]|uniref:Uncharacterized protein n=1 Tax=Chironomus riparius TaxID=315576 RepID=A0A9P0J189_9DIPT|nr:unnamed protein product [Chironomus riparius]